MANRTLKRAVKIFLTERALIDPSTVLEAVEKAFRPQTIEIHQIHLESEVRESSTIPDEQLETKAREHVARALDRRDQEAYVSHKTLFVAPIDVRMAKIYRLGDWLKGLVLDGYKLTVKVLSVVERLEKLAEGVEKLGG